MAVYVDDLQQYGSQARWCHLWADNEDELHAFAMRLGLRRSWLHVSHGLVGRWPHYDLTPNMRVKAIGLGVTEMSLNVWLRGQPPHKVS